MLLAPLMEVDWKAPDSCPSQAQFHDAVAAEVGEVAQDIAAPLLTASVEIVELPDRSWRLTMELSSPQGPDRRQFEAESCAIVVEAAAVVVSLRIVALAPDSANVDQPDWVPEPPAAANPPKKPRDARDDPTPARSSDTQSSPVNTPVRPIDPLRRPPQAGADRIALGGWLAATGGLAIGLLPGVGGAAGVEGGLEATHWRVGLALRAAPVRRRSHAQDGSIGGRFDMASAQVFGCGKIQAGPMTFPLCARFAAGAIRGVGTGSVATSTARWSNWIGLGASAAAVWRVTRRFAPFVSPELLVGLRRPTFSVGTPRSALHETGSVGFRLLAGVEFHIRGKSVHN